MQELKSEQFSGNLLNSYAWGGYIDWEIPEARVFVDGRTDLFGDEVLSNWLKIIRTEDGWQEAMKSWKIDAVLIEPDLPIVDALKNEGWKTQYQDDHSVLLHQ